MSNPSPEILKEKAAMWFHAFNIKDLDLLLSLYHKDAQHYSPKLKIKKPYTKGLIQGKKALKDWWAGAFESMPQLHYKVLNIMSDESHVFMEYLRHNPGEEDMQVGEVLHFEDGLIVFSRVYHS